MTGTGVTSRSRFQDGRSAARLASHLAAVFATARLELMATLRSRMFWVLQGVLAAPIVLGFLSDAGSGNMLRYASEQLRQILAFSLLLLPLVAWPSFNRVRGARGDLEFATTHDSVSNGVGTLLGLAGWLVPMMLAQLALRWVVGELVAGQANWTLLSIGPWLVLAPHVLGVGALACLSLFLRKLLPLLLVWLGLWVVVMQASGGLFGGFVGANFPLLNIWNVLFDGLALSPAVGLGLSRPLVAGMAAWYGLLGALLLAVWLLLAPWFDRRRQIRLYVVPVALTLLAAAGAVAALNGRKQAVVANEPVHTPREVVLDEWRVLESRLEVAFAPATDRAIVGRAWLTLAPTGVDLPGELILRLRPGLALTATTGGVTLPVQREGDSVLVNLAPLGAWSELEIELTFEGNPEWRYPDFRFQTGGSFPALDSAQPMTSLAHGGVGFLLRDGDWQPWPWTSHPQLAETSHTVRMSTVNQDGTTTERAFVANVPQLLSFSAPSGGAAYEQVGQDPGVGLSRALAITAAGAAEMWLLLGEADVPEVAAMPYLADVYANDRAVLIPEASDLRQPQQLGAMFRAYAEPGVAERVGLQVAARAWLNATVRHPRGYAEATRYTAELQGGPGNLVLGPRSGSGYRLLQVASGNLLIGSVWSPAWLGEDPGPYDVTPWALWLGLEAADPEVRKADLALLRGLDGTARDAIDLRAYGFPPFLYRRLDQVALVVALSEWTEQVGQAAALEHFVHAYSTVVKQDETSLLAALGLASGVPVRVPGGETR